MFGLSGWALYFLIFWGKLVEVSIGTAKISLISSGKKYAAAIAGLFEIAFWVVIASSVISDVRSDPLKAAAYCLAYACGIIVGVYLEQFLAIGLATIQVIVPSEDGSKTAASLREHGFGVTIFQGHSVDGTVRELLLVETKRKRISEVTRLVEACSPHAMVTVSDLKTLRGGFVK